MPFSDPALASEKERKEEDPESGPKADTEHVAGDGQVRRGKESTTSHSPDILVIKGEKQTWFLLDLKTHVRHYKDWIRFHLLPIPGTAVGRSGVTGPSTCMDGWGKLPDCNCVPCSPQVT